MLFSPIITGDYSLEISPVALEDDAVFQCQVGAVEGVLGIRSRSATFTVQVPPEAPVIVVTHAHSHAQVYKSTDVEGEVSVSAGGVAPGPSGKDHHLRTTAGMTIELTCEAHSGRPPAEVCFNSHTNCSPGSNLIILVTFISQKKSSSL